MLAARDSAGTGARLFRRGVSREGTMSERPQPLMAHVLSLALMAGLGAACTPSASAPAPASSAAAPTLAAAAAPAGQASSAAAPPPAAVAPPPREPWTYAQVSVFALYWPHFVGMQQGFFDQEGLDF